MIAALTGMGLSAAAGLNAYIPFLIVALIARFTDFITLPQSYAWIESWWAIGIGAVLLLTEVVLDKIPAIDTVNDAVQTFIRPSMGGLIFAATSAAEGLDHSSWMTNNPWVGVVLGVITSGLVHGGKTAGQAGDQRRHARLRRTGRLDRRGRRLDRAEPGGRVHPGPGGPVPRAARLAAHLAVAQGPPMAQATRSPRRPRMTG